MNNLVPLVSILIAALALTVTVVGLRHKTDDTYTQQVKDYADQLEKRLSAQDREMTQMQADLQSCKQARDGFEDKNFQLLQEVYELRKKVDRL